MKMHMCACTHTYTHIRTLSYDKLRPSVQTSCCYLLGCFNLNFLFILLSSISVFVPQNSDSNYQIAFPCSTPG